MKANIIYWACVLILWIASMRFGVIGFYHKCLARDKDAKFDLHAGPGPVITFVFLSLAITGLIVSGTEPMVVITGLAERYHLRLLLRPLLFSAEFGQ